MTYIAVELPKSRQN